MDDEFSFADWLSAELKESKMSQRAFARKVGISQYSIWNYLARGYSPHLCTLNDILNALGKKIVIVDKEEV